MSARSARLPATLLVMVCLSAAVAALLRSPPPAHADRPAATSKDAQIGVKMAVVHGLAPLPGGAPVPLHDLPPGATASDGGPSPVIFPAQKLTIRFNHQLHVTRIGMACTTCHERARTSTESEDSLTPGGRDCDICHTSDHRELHDVTTDEDTLIGQCGFCHIGYDAARPKQVQRQVLPRPNLKFDHAAHAARNIGCGQCHGAVQNVELATRDQLPRMRGCLVCHQMKGPAQGDASGECVTCHLSEPGTRLKTDFAEGSLVPPRWLGNAEHGPDFYESHKFAAGADSSFCANCHEEQECVACHDGRVRPRREHPNDFISMHPVVARQDPARCSSCHQEQTFCVGCHQRAGVTLSGPHANFAGRGRFHPPKQVWSDGPPSRGHHAWEAQRNISQCVSCHNERDCAICHATAGVGGPGTGAGRGASPHPPGFRSRCGHALRKNARPCLFCHAVQDPQLLLCR